MTENSSLREQRLAAGLSARELAEGARSKTMRIYAFETGRYHPRPPEAVRIARALEVEPVNLFPDLFVGREGK